MEERFRPTEKHPPALLEGQLPVRDSLSAPGVRLLPDVLLHLRAVGRLLTTAPPVLAAGFF